LLMRPSYQTASLLETSASSGEEPLDVTPSSIDQRHFEAVVFTPYLSTTGVSRLRNNGEENASTLKIADAEVIIERTTARAVVLEEHVYFRRVKLQGVLCDDANFGAEALALVLKRGILAPPIKEPMTRVSLEVGEVISKHCGEWNVHSDLLCWLVVKNIISKSSSSGNSSNLSAERDLHQRP